MRLQIGLRMFFQSGNNVKGEFKMSLKDYDLLIIGGGPAGGAAAETALKMGKSVALIEKDKLGGT